ncbi:response regulator [Rufibacter glacialis]|uniref:Response regulator n=1 Tax=Rufibacter glacialis TaxID=1259555 RepID=A0A5M8Q7M0_9BACT|nr:response regulator [Rufibacter glacialis]KAA6430622.1 response regulator [Rufibacter glacialis]GGK85224.1 two-component system response regulator [Rufibacter glacialis]
MPTLFPIPNHQLDAGEILVIDDDSSSLFLIQDLLTSMGLGEKVTTASSAEDALEILAEREGTARYPELLFLDIRMPHIDGFGFLERLDKLRSPNHPTPKVVILSYYGNRLYQEQAEKYGVSAYLRKPLTREKVLDLIEFRSYPN